MNKVVCLFALLALSCGNDAVQIAVDASIDSSRASDSAVARTDTVVRTDTRTDTCLATDEDAVSTVGCNGFAPARTPNGVWGPCTPGDENDPAGSCTNPDALCIEYDGVPGAYCVVPCDDTDAYVSLGGCPTGNRCFDGDADEEPGVCYQDCNATNRCPSGMECDREGSCVFPQTPPVDAGRPDATTATDANVITTDASTPATDASTPPADTGTTTSDAQTPATDASPAAAGDAGTSPDAGVLP